MAVKGEDCFLHIEQPETKKEPTLQHLAQLAFFGFKYSQTRFHSFEQIGGYLRTNFFPDYQIDEQTSADLTALVHQMVYKYLQPLIETGDEISSRRHTRLLNGESTLEQRYHRFESDLALGMNSFIDGINTAKSSLYLLTKQTIAEDRKFFYKKGREPFLFVHGFHGRPSGAREYDGMFGDMRQFTVGQVQSGEWRFDTFPELFLLSRDYQQAFPGRTLDLPQPVGSTFFEVQAPDGIRTVTL